MATRAERRRKLEPMTEGQLDAFRLSWGGEWGRVQGKDAKIERLLDDAEESGRHGHGFDKQLGLPTDTAQQQQLEWDAVAAGVCSAA